MARGAQRRLHVHDGEPPHDLEHRERQFGLAFLLGRRGGRRVERRLALFRAPRRERPAARFAERPRRREARAERVRAPPQREGAAGPGAARGPGPARHLVGVADDVQQRRAERVRGQVLRERLQRNLERRLVQAPGRVGIQEVDDFRRAVDLALPLEVGALLVRHVRVVLLLLRELGQLQLADEVLELRRPEDDGEERRRVERRDLARVAGRVVASPRLRVRQDLVGRAYFLKLRGRVGVAGVLVRVALERLPVVALLDPGRGRVRRHVQDVVELRRGDVCGRGEEAAPLLEGGLLLPLSLARGGERGVGVDRVDRVPLPPEVVELPRRAVPLLAHDRGLDRDRRRSNPPA